MAGRDLLPKSARGLPQRTQSKTARSLGIQGQSYARPGSSMDAVAAASGGVRSSLAVSAESETDIEVEDVEEVQPASDANPPLVNQLLHINQTLVRQIETLRLRLDFDSKHHEAERHAVITSSDVKLKVKDKEIKDLKQKLSSKDAEIDKLSKENDRKSEEIKDLRRQLEAIRDDVESAKSYADELVEDINILTEQKNRLEKGTAYDDKEKEIGALKTEIDVLKNNLAILEKELNKAKEVMASQNTKIRLVENDKKNVQLKFKEELAKVSQSMRLEVEKMRDVMRKQWEEMRFLREQNASMSRDIRDIRDMLVMGKMDDDAKEQELPKTSRYVTNTNSSYNTGALKPSLPVLSKDTKRVVHGKKNK